MPRWGHTGAKRDWLGDVFCVDSQLNSVGWAADARTVRPLQVLFVGIFVREMWLLLFDGVAEGDAVGDGFAALDEGSAH
jgi:hypothetical protein